MKIFKKSSIPQPINGRRVPLDLKTSFLDLEIGSGAGDFALSRSVFKNRHLIAIEKTKNRFRQFKKKYQKKGEPFNIWPIHTNGIWWLSHYGRINSFDSIFLLYPNPYPKRKQSHLRWVNHAFMPFLLSLLKPEGYLELRTNKEDYYEEFKEKIKRFLFFKLITDQRLPKKFKAQSLFEKKYLDRGEACWKLQYKKEERHL